MVIVVIGLIIVIFILLTYLFLLRKELKNITKEISCQKEGETNSLIHTKCNLKVTNKMISQINIFTKKSKDIELSYNQKNKALMKMITNISHDLRTPLTSALGYVDIISKSDLSLKNSQTELKIIEERLRRVEELINLFFEFSKTISSDKETEFKKLNLISVLEESIVNYYDDYKNCGREVILNCNQRKIYIYSNKILLLRIFDNLIGNAYKHSKGNLNIDVINDKSTRVIFSNELLDDQ